MAHAKPGIEILGKWLAPATVATFLGTLIAAADISGTCAQFSNKDTGADPLWKVYSYSTPPTYTFHEPMFLFRLKALEKGAVDGLVLAAEPPLWQGVWLEWIEQGFIPQKLGSGPYRTLRQLREDFGRLAQSGVVPDDPTEVMAYNSKGEALRKVAINAVPQRIQPSVSGPLEGAREIDFTPRLWEHYPAPWDQKKFEEDWIRLMNLLRDKGNKKPIPIPTPAYFEKNPQFGILTVSRPAAGSANLTGNEIRYAALVPGDRLVTSSDANAKFYTPVGAYMLTPGTDAILHAASYNNETANAVIDLRGGEIVADIIPGRTFEIDTPVARNVVRGTKFRSRYDAAGQVNIVSVKEGAVLVRPKNASLAEFLIGAGQSRRVTRDFVSQPEENVRVAQTTPTAPRGTGGPRPTLYWAGYSVGLTHAQCIERAESAFRAGGFTNIRNGVATNVRTGRINQTSRWVTAGHSSFNAWILTDGGKPNVCAVTVIVAGPPGSGQTEQMKNFLRDYMLDRLQSGGTTTGGGQGPTADYGDCDALAPPYYCTDDAVMVGYNLRSKPYTNVSVSDCVSLCDDKDNDDDEKKCLSFDYNRAKRECHLGTANRGTAPLKGQKGYTYYEKPIGQTTDTFQRPTGRTQTAAIRPGTMRGWSTDLGATTIDGASLVHKAPGDGKTSYFQAPKSFLGDWRGFSQLVFDKRSSGGRYYSDGYGTEGDVIISNGRMWARADIAQHHDGTWRTFKVPLRDGVWSLGGRARRLSDVLSNVTHVKIRAEYGVGADTASLRNVSLQ